MPSPKQISPKFSVSAALSAQDFAALAAAGFKSILNVRPDGESAQQISGVDAERAAASAGLQYAHIPVTKHDLFADAVVSKAQQTLEELEGPVLAYCASGQRAVILWAAVAARSHGAAGVLEALKTAGYDFEFLRDDLDAQADRARWHASSSAARPADDQLSHSTPIASNGSERAAA